MTNSTPPQPIVRPLPRWRRYTLVSAIRIRSIIETPESTQAALIMPADPTWPPIPVSADYLAKHKPAAGGYFVIDERGCHQYEPAAAFEVEYAPYLHQEESNPNTEEGK